MSQPCSATAVTADLAHADGPCANSLAVGISNLALQPTSKLFTTYELVESIFLRMTAFDLCMAATVCRYWKEVIESSKALKQYASKIQTPTIHTLGPRTTFFNRPGSDAWHFIVKGTYGRLVVARLGKHEAILFVPKMVRKRLQLIDERFERQIRLNYEFNPVPETLEWPQKERRNVRTVVFHTKGKHCLLRQYLLATFPILSDSDHRLGIRYPLYEWKDHVTI